jgi:hypothetical protein
MLVQNVVQDVQYIEVKDLQGVIRKPFAFYFPIQRGFSGSVQTLRKQLKLSVRKA